MVSTYQANELLDDFSTDSVTKASLNEDKDFFNVEDYYTCVQWARHYGGDSLETGASSGTT